MTVQIPFVPVLWSLYSAAELFDAFDGADATSYGRTKDFAIYRHYVMEGRTAPSSPFTSMMQALHDNSINGALQRVLANRKVAGIMGGHKMARDSEAYASVARLSRRLTRAGILTCSGGGPGAMEATHVGALHANLPDGELDVAIHVLSAVPSLPDLSKVVAVDGTVDPTLVAQAHQWFEPAWRIAKQITNPAESLAVPTWQYGHEPTSPLALHIAKYFQNSIREDGLLAIARQGVVYTEGKAGTLQEVFQDAAQNYYKTYGYASPMVLLGKSYWTNTFPVAPVLQNLFGANYAKYVLLTDDGDDAAAFIEAFVP